MPIARYLAVLLSLLVTDSASAQYRNTRLSEGGKALVELRSSEVKPCVSVYQWDRCAQPLPAADALVQPDPERRKKCIISSRNVAARKGATHYTVKGALFTAYRCPQRARAAPLDGAQSTGKAEGDLQALGFEDWRQACSNMEELFPSECALKSSLQAQVTCRELRARALMEGARIYRLNRVKTRVERGASKGDFRVHILGVLAQLGARSDQQYISTFPLTMARRGSATEALADAARPYTTIDVSGADLPTSKGFKSKLIVEALVRAKHLHAPRANNPSRIQAIEVDVIGLRAYLKDLSWSRIIHAPGALRPKRPCRPLESSQLEFP